jgi:hypothetical protein
MKDARINLRISADTAKKMKLYAKRNGTSLSALVDTHFKDLLEVDRQKRAVVPTFDAEQA